MQGRILVPHLLLLFLQSLLVSIATSAGNAGRAVGVTSGTKIAFWPEPPKSSLAVHLQSAQRESDKSIELLPTCENAIIAHTRVGVTLPGLTSVKSAIINFRNTFSSAGSVESWLVTGAGGTDFEMVNVQARSCKCVESCSSVLGEG